MDKENKTEEKVFDNTAPIEEMAKFIYEKGGLKQLQTSLVILALSGVPGMLICPLLMDIANDELLVLFYPKNYSPQLQTTTMIHRPYTRSSTISIGSSSIIKSPRDYITASQWGTDSLHYKRQFGLPVRSTTTEETMDVKFSFPLPVPLKVKIPYLFYPNAEAGVYHEEPKGWQLINNPSVNITPHNGDPLTVSLHNLTVGGRYIA